MKTVSSMNTFTCATDTTGVASLKMIVRSPHGISWSFVLYLLFFVYFEVKYIDMFHFTILIFDTESLKERVQTELQILTHENKIYSGIHAVLH